MSLKRFGFVLTGLLYLISLPAEAYIPQLTPQSFEQLYAYAAAGKVEVITNAVSRGMNIDSVNANGDTGLCVAAKRGNRTAYKSFLMAGANPSHQCTWNISGYRDFMNSVISNPVKNLDTAAVAKYGKKSMSWTTKALIGAGVVAAGAGTAIALSGGGGGGGGSSVDPNCVHGHYDDSNVCVCDTGYAGDKCNDCASGYGNYGTSECYKDIDDCGHGHQVGPNCQCDTGYSGTYCGACAAGYGKNSSGLCEKKSASVIGNSAINSNYNEAENLVLSNNSYADVYGLFYDSAQTPHSYILESDKFANGYAQINKTKAQTSEPDYKYNDNDKIIWYATDTTTPMGYIDDSIAYNNAGEVAGSAVDDIIYDAGGDKIGEAYKYGSKTVENDYLILNKSSSINITNNSDGDVYGLYSNNVDTIYNTYIKLNETGILVSNIDTKAPGTAEAQINITNKGDGNIYGIFGTKTIYSGDYAGTATEGSARASVVSTIMITNQGNGSAYGIYNGSSAGVIYHQTKQGDYFYLQSITAVENTSGGGDTYGLYTLGTMENSGNVYSSADAGNAYGLYTKGGTITNVKDLSETGLVYSVVSTSASGAAYGAYLEDGAMTNGRVLKVSTTGGTKNAYGIYVVQTSNGTATLNNTSGIEVQSAGGDAYGIYNKGGSVTNSTQYYEIKVNSTSGNAYGIYSDGGTVNNSGRINVVGPAKEKTYGIYATNGAQITNGGYFEFRINNIELDWQDSSSYCTSSGCLTPDGGYAIYLTGGATLVNAGVLASTSALSLGTKGVTLAASGKISSPVLSGGLSISSGAVTSGFDQTYTLTGAIDAADTSALNLSSQSVLFDAALDGKNVVLTKKSFNDVIENASFADFLEENYSAGKNEALFGMLKSEKNLSTLNKMAQDLTGANLSRFALDDMMAIKELDFQFNDAVLNNTKPEFALSGETVPPYLKNKTNSHSRWALSGKKEGNKTYGVGMALTTTRSLKDKKNDKRYDQMFQMVMPISYERGGFEFITTPRLGYAYGTYTRQGFNGSSYDGKIEKRIFGLSNAARYPVLFEGWTLSPTLEFNAVGYHIKGHEDNKQFALKINKQNIASVEAGFGLGLSKALKIEKEGDLKFNSQVMLYHEFADPYKLKLSMQDMDGSFVVNDEKRRKEHLTVKTGLEYHLKGFSIYSNLFSYIDSTYHTKADIGFKYAF